jgi:nucleotide-binding universal stress UspA family protein
MLRDVLVPLDGSGVAERALAYATGLSVKTGARLLLLRVEIGFPLADVPDDRARAVATARAQQYLDPLVADLTGRGFVARSEVEWGPHAAHVICDVAQREPIDLVVMTSRGRTGASHVLFGSVTEEVIAQTPCPVLVERAGHPICRELLLERLPRILVTLDGSARSEVALGAATGLAQSLRGELVLLAVEDQISVPADGGAEYLMRVIERWQTHPPGVPVRTCVRAGSAVDEIVATSADLQVAMVVMATHARIGIERLRLGSIAGRVLQTTSAPVVLVRTGAAAEPASAVAGPEPGAQGADPAG